MALTTGSIESPIRVPDTHRATAPIWIVHTAFDTIALTPGRLKRLARAKVEIRGWHAAIHATTYLTLCIAAVWAGLR